MADYQLGANDSYVVRTADHASIPNEPLNKDWVAYQAWLAVPNVPDPYPVPPPIVPVLDRRQFWSQAAIANYIAMDEALDAMRGELPQTIQDYISTLPQNTRFAARMAFLDDSFERGKPGAARFKEAFSLTDQQMDAFFFAAGVL